MSCTTYSPRSVSTTSMPFASSAGLRWISSDSIDLAFTATFTPRDVSTPATMSRASASSPARCTVMPLASQRSMNCGSSSARLATAWLRTCLGVVARGPKPVSANRRRVASVAWSVARGMAWRRKGRPSWRRLSSSNGVGSSGGW